jgi:signal transduction histidine kinase
MKPKLGRSLVPLILLAATFIVALNAWVAFRAVDALTQAEYLVEHTWQVINQTERIMSSAKDAETGNRGFLITGEDIYLEPYTDAVQELPDELDRFQSLTADNPEQQRNVAEMRQAIQRRLELLRQGIEVRRKGSLTSPELLHLSGTGKVEMDRLRAIADRMEFEEQRLLAIRANGAARSAIRARYAVAVASALDIILILLMFRYFVRERGLRVDAENTNQQLAAARVEVEARAREISALNTTLEERVKQRTLELETTNRELEAFSYSVSHDLRAPLRTIDGFSLALEEDYAEAVDAVGRDYIHRVRSGVQRMGQLIDSLLQLSRITRADLVREPVDLTELAESVAAALSEENPDRNLQISVAPGMTAEGDAKLLRVALENLMGNAVKFSSKMSETIVKVGWDRDQKAWFVRDNGAGFDMHYSGKLFNAFNRLHGDKDFKGSGIGLATVARVIRRHHGRIWAESAIDHGATFWFTLG